MRGSESGAGRHPFIRIHTNAQVYEIEATFVVTDPQAKFGIKVGVNGKYGVSVGYNSQYSTLFLDRTQIENSEFSSRFTKYMLAPLAREDGLVKLHLYVDQSSLEVFANDGEVTMSALMFPDTNSLCIELFAENGSVILQSLTAWELESIWEVLLHKRPNLENERYVTIID